MNLCTRTCTGDLQSYLWSQCRRLLDLLIGLVSVPVFRSFGRFKVWGTSVTNRIEARVPKAGEDATLISDRQSLVMLSAPDKRLEPQFDFVSKSFGSATVEACYH
jgi:hypothetical protein